MNALNAAAGRLRQHPLPVTKSALFTMLAVGVLGIGWLQGQ
ncbi:hypothetical protein [Aliamphritea spongicola]|nr:hypothetical protein [Aliamphritea spongicola]